VEGGPSDERRSVRSISEMWILTIKMWKILGTIGKMGEYSGKSSINDGNQNIPSGNFLHSY
jgi:hypothetical protein